MEILIVRSMKRCVLQVVPKPDIGVHPVCCSCVIIQTRIAIIILSRSITRAMDCYSYDGFPWLSFSFP